MKITKKLKAAIIVIWATAIITMVIGTMIIGQYYITGTYGANHSLQLIYSETDPLNDIYKSVSALREDVITKVKEEPEYYTVWENADELNEKAGADMTSILVKINDEYTYVGLSELSDAMKKQLQKNDSSDNINAVEDELTETVSDASGIQLQIQEYLMTKPSMYLCNQISYKTNSDSVNIYMLTYYGNYMTSFRGAVIGYSILMLLIMIMLSGIIAVLVYRQFVNPLVKLKEAAERMGSGNLNDKVDGVGHRMDEIGELCDSFEEMRQKLSDFVNEKMQYEEENRQLISNISHDLRTPITTIKGYVEGIMDGVADTPEKQERYLKMIYSKANEMDSLINELSLYTNINNNAIPYEFHRVSVKDYFGDCMEEIQATLMSENMTFSYENFCEDDVRVIVDPDQLKRVINNIVTNAIKYNDKDKGQVDITINDNGSEVKVSISDNGPGIDKESLPHIFDRMYRADSARQSKGGSGLGLAICKKIVEEHGGMIYATSQVGKGTTVVFTLKKFIPREETGDDAAEDDSAKTSPKIAKNARGVKTAKEAKIIKDARSGRGEDEGDSSASGDKNVSEASKNILQIINPLKKRRESDEQDIDN